MQTTAKINIVTDEVLNFLAAGVTPEQILAFRPSEIVDARAHYLLERNRNQRLTLEEREELDEFAHINQFMTMLKIRARKQ
ncbi:MAG: hypothetical protein SGI73_05525 [Chloroflexota bacterium]|nr:hypothetical protein [Chloroflexota bacterium]